MKTQKHCHLPCICGSINIDEVLLPLLSFSENLLFKWPFCSDCRTAHVRCCINHLTKAVLCWVLQIQPKASAEHFPVAWSSHGLVVSQCQSAQPGHTFSEFTDTGTSVQLVKVEQPQLPSTRPLCNHCSS